MSRFLVGVNGEHTPDPAYWRARNEVVTADSEQEAKEQWKKMVEGWYCGEPISVVPFPFTEEEQLYPYASNWQFVGTEEIQEVC